MRRRPIVVAACAPCDVPWGKRAKGTATALEAVQAVSEAYTAYISEGSPFNDFELLLTSAASRIKLELSPFYPQGWLKIFEDERARVVSFSALEDRLTSAETHE